MELRALDENFIVVGPTRIRYSDLMWHRKYYEAGKFSVQMRTEQYEKTMAYIYTPERPELGVIQKVKYSEDEKEITLSGFFFEKKLFDKIIFPGMSMSGTRSAITYDAVERYKGDIPRLVSTAYDDTEEEVIQKEEIGTELGEMAYRTLQIEEKSFRCIYDFESGNIIFEIYKGKDRTQSQNENNFVTFSKGFRNLKNVIATKDDSAFKNYFVAAGDQDEKGKQIIVVLDISGGGYKREAYIDDTNKKFEKSSQTEEEYKETLMQDIAEKAKKYVSIQNVEFDTILNAGAKYLEDYDLGDKCDIIIEEIMMSFEARIIEVLETWNKGVHQVTLTFGDKIPTQYEKARIK